MAALNRALTKVGMHFASQNLNDRTGGKKGPMWRAGRAWLYLRQDDAGQNSKFGVEWVLGRVRFGLRLTVDAQYGDDDFVISLSLPLVSLYLSAENVLPAALIARKPEDPHAIGFSIHDGGLWWDCWQNDVEWRSGTPKWRHGHFDPMDFMFGRMDHHRHSILTASGLISMPEKDYPCTVELFESVWHRRRFPYWPLTRRMRRAEVDVDGGVPFPGKGENSWDCGEDATYSMTTQATTVSEAIGKFSLSVIRDRVKNGGPTWRPATKQADGGE